MLKENPERWAKCLSNEWGRLSLGNFNNVVYDYRPLKDEKWRVRLVVGGDKLVYEADSGSPTTDMVETFFF